jgi:signal transduction histidine kinase
MDTLLHDERVRVVLRQLPRFLSTSIPLSVKLEELCEAALEVVGVDCAAVALLSDDPQLTHTQGVDPGVLSVLADPQRVAALVATGDVTHQATERSTGAVIALRSGGETYGALYAGHRGEVEPFDDDTTSLLRMLAEAVGPTIHHGMRLLDTERAERWSAAAVRLGELFLAEESDDPYQSLVDVVWDLGEADSVGIVVPRDHEVHIAVARGLGLEELSGMSLPTEGSYSSQLMREGRGVITDMSTRPSPWFAQVRPDVRLGPMIALPLNGSQGPIGVLFMARREGAPPYLHQDLKVVETFAVNAAVSMEWHAARRTHDELRMLQERNRIARDLHDNVVQRLFATGLYLQQAARTLDGEAKDRVESAMTSVDQTIRQIRNTILVLRSTAADRLDKLLLTIVAETEPLLGFPPKLQMVPDTSRVTGPLAADLALCVREALSNVVQHAQASGVEIEVTVDDSTVDLRISDDGIGMRGERRPGGGLENLDERARAHGGTFSYESEPGEGTTLRWHMPLPAV